MSIPWAFIGTEGNAECTIDLSGPTASRATRQADAGCERVEIIAPRAWVANPRLCESSLDLHQGLDVNEAEIDTVPADLLKDLFKFV